MPNLTLSGVVLGLRSKPYDFTDDAGKQNKGVSNRLFLWDNDVMEPIEIAVPTDRLGLASDLAQGQHVAISVTVSANNNRASFRFSAVEATGGQVFTVKGDAKAA